MQCHGVLPLLYKENRRETMRYLPTHQQFGPASL